MVYRCTICGYEYDEEEEGVKFSDLPDTWTCPGCGAVKELFEPVKGSESKKDEKVSKVDLSNLEKDLEIEVKSDDTDKMYRLSTSELSILCSNLARGCEKQYMETEAKNFRILSDYLDKISSKVKGADLTSINKLVNDDLNENYKKLRMVSENDRGTKRAITWNEKVTNIHNALLKQYEREGEAMFAGKFVWLCTVCGFIYVGEKAPELCPVCKVPSWKFEKVEKG